MMTETVENALFQIDWELPSKFLAERLLEKNLSGKELQKVIEILEDKRNSFLNLELEIQDILNQKFCFRCQNSLRNKNCDLCERCAKEQLEDEGFLPCSCASCLEKMDKKSLPFFVKLCYKNVGKYDEERLVPFPSGEGEPELFLSPWEVKKFAVRGKVLEMNIPFLFSCENRAEIRFSKEDPSFQEFKDFLTKENIHFSARSSPFFEVVSVDPSEIIPLEFEFQTIFFKETPYWGDEPPYWDEFGSEILTVEEVLEFYGEGE